MVIDPQTPHDVPLVRHVPCLGSHFTLSLSGQKPLMMLAEHREYNYVKQINYTKNTFFFQGKTICPCRDRTHDTMQSRLASRLATELPGQLSQVGAQINLQHKKKAKAQ